MMCNHNNIFNALNVDISLTTWAIIFTIIIVLDMTLEITPMHKDPTDMD